MAGSNGLVKIIIHALSGLHIKILSLHWVDAKVAITMEVQAVDATKTCIRS